VAAIGKMKKIISFSLYGENPKYCIGAIENVKLQPLIYPDWICRIYYDNSVPEKYIDELRDLKIELVDMTNSGMDNHGMFWRFLVYDDKSVERFIVRDTDSRLNFREKYAVDEWIETDKKLHIMRDHPSHGIQILGGTWGLLNSFDFNMKDAIIKFLEIKPDFKYMDDQIFLTDLYRKYFKSHICHDEIFNFPCNLPFPTPRKELEFVGEVFDEKNNNVPEHTELLKNYLKQTNQL
jgi:protein O-GlcNAc transferase